MALVTGASRRQGIAAAIAQSLARDGWDVATTFWRAYDERVHATSDPMDVAWLRAELEACGAKTAAVEADLSLVESAGSVFDAVECALGGVTALVLSHAEGVDSDLLTTTVERRSLRRQRALRGEQGRAEPQRADFIRRTPAGRVGQPEDCARLVRFLCSPEGGWVNGQILHSNGGLYTRLW